MLKNYLLIAFRVIRRQPGYSLINLAGLAIGMAICLLILLFVQDELSYDAYHENGDRLYRIEVTGTVAGETTDFALCPFAAPPAFAEEIPEVESYSRLLDAGSQVLTVDGRQFEEQNVLFADSTFFRLFTHEFIAGDNNTALDVPNSAVIAQSAADRIFPGLPYSDVIGQSYTIGPGSARFAFRASSKTYRAIHITRSTI